jgi:hypothetical protein
MKIESISTVKKHNPLCPLLIESRRTASFQFVAKNLLGPSITDPRAVITGFRYIFSTVLRRAVFMLDYIQAFHAQ